MSIAPTCDDASFFSIRLTQGCCQQTAQAKNGGFLDLIEYGLEAPHEPPSRKYMDIFVLWPSGPRNLLTCETSLLPCLAYGRIAVAVHPFKNYL